MRTIVIFCVNDGAPYWENVVSRLPDGSRVVIFQREGLDDEETRSRLAEFGRRFDIRLTTYPDSMASEWTKLRNLLVRRLVEEGVNGKLHVVEDLVEITSDPMPFLDAIEDMMDVLHLKSWFNTSCDRCNFVYSKYNPRMYISVDEPEAAKRYHRRVAWCSNANTAWICYDLDRASLEDIRFEERLNFPMYYIIEFLARRRNTKAQGQLDYMNYYPSVDEELGVFRYSDFKQVREFTKEEIDADGKTFQEMAVDNRPDQSVDVVIEDMRAAILSD